MADELERAAERRAARIRALGDPRIFWGTIIGGAMASALVEYLARELPLVGRAMSLTAVVIVFGTAVALVRRAGFALGRVLARRAGPAG